MYMRGGKSEVRNIRIGKNTSKKKKQDCISEFLQIFSLKKDIQ